MTDPLLAFRGRTDGVVQTWDDAVRGELSFRTLFSRDTTNTTAMSTGIAYLPPGGWLGHHRHAATEIYYIVTGSGRVTVGATEHDLHAGDSVFMAANVEHGISNDGLVPLEFLYVFNVASFDDVEYDFTVR